MKNICLISLLFVCIGCSDIQIKLNDSSVSFRSFPETDSLKFTAISGELLQEPSAIKLYRDYLIIQSFNKAHDKWISLFSLQENRILKELIGYGQGPEEMIGCDIGLFDDKIWLYDMTKKRIGILPVDSFLTTEPLVIPKHTLDRNYYTVTMANDSIMLGTNDVTSTSKISYL
ncbi:MAG: TolB-like 6-bladed beta-propeller domain-containing protein, partial [Tannerella sp.]|nr:TolB-like 6-bladed beta-propeller domain-containing protein [Tannerella sp.]